MFTQIRKLIGIEGSRRGDSKLESGGAHRISLIILIVVGILGYYGIPFEGVFTLLMLGVSTYEVEKRMDQGLPLMQVAALLAVVQWVVGPWICYNVDFDYKTYYMRVPSETYFTYAIPGTAAFVVGLLAMGASARQRDLLKNVDRSQFMLIGMVLAGIGFASALAGKIFPGGLSYVFFLLSALRYVAALYFLFSRHPLRWWLVGISVLPLLTGSADSGMFHDLLLWTGILACYVFAFKRRRVWQKAMVLICGVAVIFTIQGVKWSYRDKVWQQEEGSLTEEVTEFWGDDQTTFSEETLSKAVVRINQGWIIAAILQNVPDQEPYAMGDTLGEAVSAALIPRIIATDKAIAGGQVSFRRFTGLPLSDNTSMGISLLGEGYANVGPTGGIFLMLIFGGGMSLAYGGCLRWSVAHPTFYFWIPVIFCQAIKAETDLVTVLNQLTKASVVVFGMYWLICVQLIPVGSIRRKKRLSNFQDPRARERSANKNDEAKTGLNQNG